MPDTQAGGWRHLASLLPEGVAHATRVYLAPMLLDQNLPGGTLVEPAELHP